MSIALKEAGESGFWIDLLYRSHYLNDDEFNILNKKWNHVYAVLVKIVKATKPQIFKIKNPVETNQK